MERLFSIKESQALDRRLIGERSLSEEKLIDSAAAMAYGASKAHIENKSVLFLVGKGNNGSDALEMARLSIGYAKGVYVYPLFPTGNEENMRRRRLLDESVFVSSLVETDTIVDGVFGFSFRGKLDERLEELFLRVEESKAYKIALDLPSAFSYKADLTVTFMCRKSEMYYPGNREKCGRIEVFNPGFSEDAIPSSSVSLLEDDDYSVSPLSSSSYKNRRGHLLVAGGSERYPGAPLLSSLSAFHAGVGLVTMLSERSVLDKVYATHPSIMGIGKEHLSSVAYGASVVGPGWNEGDRETLLSLVAEGKPMVVDADAIKLIKAGDSFNRKAVITPHLGELRTLSGNLKIKSDDFLSLIKTIAITLEAVLVVKCDTVWITDGEKVYVYDGSNPSMGVAGSGDVLSGIIGAFLAKGDDPMTAAINGVILHQNSGKTLSRTLGYYTAEDLIMEVGRER